MAPLWQSAVFDYLSGDAPEPTIDIADICSDIRAGTKGWGTDEDALIKALGSIGPIERYQVAKHFEETHEINLAKLMKKENGNGSLGKALQLLACPIEEAEAMVLKDACKGVGTNEELIYATLCGRTNEELTAIKEAFLRLNGEGLGDLVEGELGGDLKCLLMMILDDEAEEEKYDPEVHTEEKAEDDAKLFDKAGFSQLGSDEEGLFKVILRSPPEHLKQVNYKYVDRTGHSITKSLEEELGGDAKDAAVHLVNMKLKPIDTAVRLIEKSMKGVGTDEYILTTAILRYQALLGEILPAYEEECGETLEEQVKSELRGDFEKLIVKMINYKP
ncbi:hypothetical protein ACHAXR_009089 [Thalassiosira sp. AJA248-18]